MYASTSSQNSHRADPGLKPERVHKGGGRGAAFTGLRAKLGPGTHRGRDDSRAQPAQRPFQRRSHIPYHSIRALCFDRLDRPTGRRQNGACSNTNGTLARHRCRRLEHHGGWFAVLRRSRSPSASVDGKNAPSLGRRLAIRTDACGKQRVQFDAVGSLAVQVAIKVIEKSYPGDGHRNVGVLAGGCHGEVSIQVLTHRLHLRQIRA